MELDERDRQFIESARTYAQGPAPGFPGHKLILLVAKLADELQRVLAEHEMRFTHSGKDSLIFFDDVSREVRIYRVSVSHVMDGEVSMDGEWVASIPYDDLKIVSDPSCKGRVRIDSISPGKPLNVTDWLKERKNE